jgi:hypothetical protein
LVQCIYLFLHFPTFGFNDGITAFLCFLFLTFSLLSFDLQAFLFKASGFRRYPVMKDNRLVGQISRKDVLRALEKLSVAS